MQFLAKLLSFSIFFLLKPNFDSICDYVNLFIGALPVFYWGYDHCVNFFSSFFVQDPIQKELKILYLSVKQCKDLINSAAILAEHDFYLSSELLKLISSLDSIENIIKEDLKDPHLSSGYRSEEIANYCEDFNKIVSVLNNLNNDIPLNNASRSHASFQTLLTYLNSLNNRWHL